MIHNEGIYVHDTSVDKPIRLVTWNRDGGLYSVDLSDAQVLALVKTLADSTMRRMNHG